MPHNELYMGHDLRFEDSDKPANIKIARKLMIEGARFCHAELDVNSVDSSGVLVHCAWGQNRSGSICVAYAILWQNWEPSRAINYVKEQVRKRRFHRPNPMFNKAFNQLLGTFVPNRRGEVPAVSTASPLDRYLLRRIDAEPPIQPTQTDNAATTPSQPKKRKQSEPGSVVIFFQPPSTTLADSGFTPSFSSSFTSSNSNSSIISTGNSSSSSSSYSSISSTRDSNNSTTLTNPISSSSPALSIQSKGKDGPHPLPLPPAGTDGKSEDKMLNDFFGLT
jgi:hypothetical protein